MSLKSLHRIRQSQAELKNYLNFTTDSTSYSSFIVFLPNKLHYAYQFSPVFTLHFTVTCFGLYTEHIQQVLIKNKKYIYVCIYI